MYVTDTHGTDLQESTCLVQNVSPAMPFGQRSIGTGMHLRSIKIVSRSIFTGKNNDEKA